MRTESGTNTVSSPTTHASADVRSAAEAEPSHRPADGLGCDRNRLVLGERAQPAGHRISRGERGAREHEGEEPEHREHPDNVRLPHLGCDGGSEPREREADNRREGDGRDRADKRVEAVAHDEGKQRDERQSDEVAGGVSERPSGNDGDLAHR